MSTKGKHWKLSAESKLHVSEALLETFKNGRKNHTEGKTKDDYEPLQRVSEKLKAHKRTVEHQNKLNEIYSHRKENVEYIEKLRKSRSRQITSHIAKYENVLISELIKIDSTFIAQHPIHSIGFLTLVDIYHPLHKVCIYIDGSYWHNEEKDNLVDNTLKQLGYKVVRIKYDRYRDITSEMKNSHIKLILDNIQ